MKSLARPKKGKQSKKENHGRAGEGVGKVSGKGQGEGLSVRKTENPKFLREKQNRGGCRSTEAIGKKKKKESNLAWTKGKTFVTTERMEYGADHQNKSSTAETERGQQCW